jgi:hypothetical protein
MAGCIVVSKETVEKTFGPDTAHLYERSCEGEFTKEDIEFAKASKEDFEVLEALKGWNPDNPVGSAKWFNDDLYEYFLGEMLK